MNHMKYRYTYHGKMEVELPLHGIVAKPGDTDKVYETEEPIRHPNFVEVKKGAEKNKPTK